MSIKLLGELNSKHIWVNKERKLIYTHMYKKSYALYSIDEKSVMKNETY